MTKIKTIIYNKCLNCGNNHEVEQKELNRGFGKFCSRRCSSIHRILNLAPAVPNVTCAHCNVEFYMNTSKQTNSKSGLFFCCREHKDVAQKVGGIQAIMPSHYGTGAPENTYRRIAFANKAKICERCGFNQHESAIIVHHRDRNRENNSPSNLEILCANCHAIEHWSEK